MIKNTLLDYNWLVKQNWLLQHQIYATRLKNMDTIGHVRTYVYMHVYMCIRMSTSISTSKSVYDKEQTVEYDSILPFYKSNT